MCHLHALSFVSAAGLVSSHSREKYQVSTPHAVAVVGHVARTSFAALHWFEKFRCSEIRKGPPAIFALLDGVLAKIKHYRYDKDIKTSIDFLTPIASVIVCLYYHIVFQPLSSISYLTPSPAPLESGLITAPPFPTDSSSGKPNYYLGNTTVASMQVMARSSFVFASASTVYFPGGT